MAAITARTLPPAAPGQKIGFAASAGSEDLKGGKHKGYGCPSLIARVWVPGWDHSFSRDSRLRAPRPAPAARAASAPHGPGTHRQLGRREGEAKAGPGRARHNMAEHRSCSRGSQQPPPGHPAASRQRQLRWRPRQHHIPLPPAGFLPSSLPRCHGNAAPRHLAPPLLPSRLPRPAQASLPPPTRAAAAPPGCPEGGWGKVASGRAGRARKARRGTPRD